MDDDDDFIIVNDDDDWERIPEDNDVVTASYGADSDTDAPNVETERQPLSERIETTQEKKTAKEVRAFTEAIGKEKQEIIQPRERLPGILEDIIERPKRFDFFNVVSTIQRSHPDAQPVGERGLPQKEIIRFTPHLSMGFPSSEIQAVDLQKDADENQRFAVSSNIMSIYGHASPLPAYFSEQLIEYERDDDNTLPRHFLDIFNHRILSLLFRSWQKYHAESDFRGDGSSFYSRRLSTMLGLDVPANKNLTIPPHAMLGYAGLLSQVPRSAEALQSLLADWFDPIPVSIEQCTEQWVDIDSQDQCRLGRYNHRLGEEAVLGDRSHSQISAFTIKLGPLDRHDFAGFLPEEKLRRMLEDLLSLYNPDNLLSEIELQVNAEALDEVSLGSNGGRLGLTTRLGNAQCDYHIRSRLKGMSNG